MVTEIAAGAPVGADEAVFVWSVALLSFHLCFLLWVFRFLSYCFVLFFFQTDVGLYMCITQLLSTGLLQHLS